MSDIADTLMNRAETIAAICSAVPGDKLWRWGDWTQNKGLRVGNFSDGGTNIGYRRKDDKEALLSFSNIRPADKLRNQKIVTIPVGKEKVLDLVTIPILNYDGITELPIVYESEFSKLMTAEEALAIGFKQSLETTFTFQQGGDAASVKFEQEIKIGIESSQDSTNTTSTAEGERRLGSISPVCPPGYDITYRLERYVQPAKIRITGIGDVEHGIAIGKHWDKRWKGNHGEGGKKYSRHLEWDTFEDFIRVVKGDGRRDMDGTEWFNNHPASKHLIKKLEEALDMPFEHESPEFNGATKIVPSQEVVRGPKSKFLVVGLVALLLVCHALNLIILVLGLLKENEELTARNYRLSMVEVGLIITCQ